MGISITTVGNICEAKIKSINPRDPRKGNRERAYPAKDPAPTHMATTENPTMKLFLKNVQMIFSWVNRNLNPRNDGSAGQNSGGILATFLFIFTPVDTIQKTGNKTTTR